MSSSTTRRPNRRGEGAKLREEIVQAAGELLEESGSAEGVTLRAVARKVGIAAPSIYAHFDDREAIVVAVVEQAFGELTAGIRAAAEGVEDPVERLLVTATAYATFAFERPARYQVIFGRTGALDLAGVGPPRLDAVPADGRVDAAMTVGAESFGLLVEAIAGCVEAGRSRSRNPWNEAVLVWVALHGYATLACGMPDFPWQDRDGTVRSLVGRLALLH